MTSDITNTMNEIEKNASEKIENLLKGKMNRTDIEVIKAFYELPSMYRISIIDGLVGEKNIVAHYNTKTRMNIERLDNVTKGELKKELNTLVRGYN